ncbi:MAG: hypothetical protein PPHEINF_6204 [uncultured Paraburkholderia sp.]|nr:MAG: hypothetical protein PPHEINF_6204 [uncultured Paraburkholderia sp.]CAH2809440.1 MAG: hypothetical protein PPHEESC_6147 [uncultured Paraburkholderia sp.]CAH2945125.1 MAG: hypothetical protein PPHERAN_6202 [uncultured Paraburkholderia sp.]CAH2945279.1 MAG: hypothetical protein PPHEMADMSA_6235 [uncultured Paraburkholderia sp.]
MKVYAYIQNGEVFGIIEPVARDIDSPEGGEPSFKAGDEVPIEQRYHPTFVANCVDITGISPQPQQRWKYDKSLNTFSPTVNGE